MKKHPLHQPFHQLSEDQHRTAYLGQIPRLDGPVFIMDYQPNWPHLFEEEAQAIRRVLGSAILALEHVGSTAVMGLCAKPVIDIDLSVADSADEAVYLPPLEVAGYRLVIREPDWQQHRMLKGPHTDINLHVWTIGSLEAQRHLVFRDWLIRNAADRQQYDQLKRALAKQVFTYMHEYNQVKAALIFEIYERAFANLST